MHLSTNTLQNNVLDPETESCDITEGDNAVIIQENLENMTAVLWLRAISFFKERRHLLKKALAMEPGGALGELSPPALRGVKCFVMLHSRLQTSTSLSRRGGSWRKLTYN